MFLCQSHDYCHIKMCNECKIMFLFKILKRRAQRWRAHHRPGIFIVYGVISLFGLMCRIYAGFGEGCYKPHPERKKPEQPLKDCSIVRYWYIFFNNLYSKADTYQIEPRKLEFYPMLSIAFLENKNK